jgi:hypothetical protein
MFQYMLFGIYLNLFPLLDFYKSFVSNKILGLVKKVLKFCNFAKFQISPFHFLFIYLLQPVVYLPAVLLILIHRIELFLHR